MISEQDKLIQRAISKSSTAPVDAHRVEAKRLGIMDEFGLDRAKQFIEDQRKYLTTCRSQFVDNNNK